MRATKKQAKKNIAGKEKLSPEINFFSKCFLYLPKLTVFRKSSTIQCARWAGKKHMFFFSNALPKCNALAHLKQRKKHSGLTLQSHCFIHVSCLHYNVRSYPTTIFMFLDYSTMRGPIPQLHVSRLHCNVRSYPNTIFMFFVYSTMYSDLLTPLYSVFLFTVQSAVISHH